MIAGHPQLAAMQLGQSCGTQHRRRCRCSGTLRLGSCQRCRLFGAALPARAWPCHVTQQQVLMAAV